MRILLKYIQKFGFLKGTRLYFQMYWFNAKKIKVPGLRSPLYIRPHTSDKQVFYQVVVINEYAIGFDQDPKIIIDAGANIGLFTLEMQQRFPNSKIIAIEPDNDNFSVLKKNVGTYKNVHLENRALWNKETKLIIHDKYDMGKWAMVVEENKDKGAIPTLTIPMILANHKIEHIDILKIDIETSEKALFSENYAEWLPKVKTIIIELHDRMLPGCSQAFFKAIQQSFTRYTYAISGENTIITNSAGSMAEPENKGI